MGKPTRNELIQALRLCSTNAAESVPACYSCYLYLLSRDGYMPTGETCFQRLILDVIAQMEQDRNELKVLRRDSTKAKASTESCKDTMAAINAVKCCMCPGAVCPGIPGSLHPDPTPCRLTNPECDPVKATQTEVRFRQLIYDEYKGPKEGT